MWSLITYGRQARTQAHQWPSASSTHHHATQNAHPFRPAGQAGPRPASQPARPVFTEPRTAHVHRIYHWWFDVSRQHVSCNKQRPAREKLHSAQATNQLAALNQQRTIPQLFINTTSRTVKRLKCRAIFAQLLSLNDVVYWKNCLQTTKTSLLLSVATGLKPCQMIRHNGTSNNGNFWHKYRNT